MVDKQVLSSVMWSKIVLVLFSGEFYSVHVVVFQSIRYIDSKEIYLFVI